jgi:hypothetical protein
MGILDRFEAGVERAMNGAFSRFGRSEVKAVELTSRLRRELDDKAIVMARDHTIAPNEFTVTLAPTDYEHVKSWGIDTLRDELAGSLTDYAADQHFAFAGPVSVGFEASGDQTTGKFKIRSASVRGAVAPSTASPSGSRHPIIDIDGHRYELRGPVTVIGRDNEADIVVDDPGISRRHLQIEVTSDGVIARDLGSTNGLFVEGHQVEAATLLDGNTLSIGRTRIMFWSATPGSQEAW